MLAAFALAASAQSADESRRQLIERDAEIERLKRKIEALEKERAGPPDQDEEMTRALERALVQQGGALLRRGTYELEPELSYSHWDKTRSIRRYTLQSALSLRAGLGWDSQAQVRLPYVHVSTAAGDASGLGDVELSWAKQLSSERGSLPALVGALGWVSRTGEDGFNGEIPTGGGFDVFQAGMTATKRHDPLVYYGNVSYAVARPRTINDVRLRPGDTLGVRLGSILAASPHSSVSLGLNLAFVGESEANAQDVPDSDTVLGTLQVGFAAVLTRRVMLNVTTDVRLSGDVPNFRLGISLPVRF